MTSKETKYWIKYTGGALRFFFAKNDKEARHYFMMEGDHAIDFGKVGSKKIPH